MMATHDLYLDSFFWQQRLQVEEAERNYHIRLAGGRGEGRTSTSEPSDLQRQIAQARQQIQNSIKEGGGSVATLDGELQKQIQKLQQENKQLREVTENLQSLVKKLDQRVTALEKGGAGGAAAMATKQAAKPADDDDDDDDDDFELFGSDDEDEEESAEAARIKEERLKAYQDKKSKKPKVIAKSNIILDVKPWDDETDMKELERCVRTIEMDGLLWGAAKLVPLAYGIKKLQISCVVEDDKVSTDDLEEQILAFEDLIQSMDIAAFNKI